MNKFYINEANGRQYYVYQYQNNEVKYLSLNKSDSFVLLQKIIDDNIRHVRDKDKYLEIIFESGFSLVIDNIKVFLPHKDNYDEHFYTLLNKVKDFIERKSISEYKKTLPPNYIPKVNRKRKRRLTSQRLIVGTISFALSVSLLASLFSKEMAKGAEKNLEEFNTSISYNVPEEATSEVELITSEDDSIKVELAFADEADNGKLDQTIELCASYLDPWIERYGLPKDLTYALVAQEYGLLDFSVNSSGACGPMQLQVNAFHNDDAIEYIKVAVYEDGVFTGKYDEFYVADANRLDDPRLEGKNYLVIQDVQDHFQIACAQLQRCIEKYQNIFIAVDAYNKGLYALSSICDEETLNYYQNNFNDFSWIDLILESYGENYGDKDYLWHVLRYLDTDTRGQTTITYYYQGEEINVDLTNTTVYNSELSR